MREKKPAPTYYAIIPANVRYAPISANAKLLYGELTAMCSVKGYCWATNQYFADLYGVHKDTVSEWVQQLVASKFIQIRQLKNERRLALTVKTPRGLGENTQTPLGENTSHSITSKSITENTDSDTNVSLATPDKTGVAVNEILTAFKALTDKPLYANKTQRDAVARLLKQYSKTSILKAIGFASSIRGKQYAPVIITPLHLEEKFGALVDYAKRAKGEKPKVINLNNIQSGKVVPTREK